MEYKGNKLLEACKICMEFNVERGGSQSDQYGCGKFETSSCLYKDRAIIVLLDRLLKKLDKNSTDM